MDRHGIIRVCDDYNVLGFSWGRGRVRENGKPFSPSSRLRLHHRFQDGRRRAAPLCPAETTPPSAVPVAAYEEKQTTGLSNRLLEEISVLK